MFLYLLYTFSGHLSVYKVSEIEVKMKDLKRSMKKRMIYKFITFKKEKH